MKSFRIYNSSTLNIIGAFIFIALLSQEIYKIEFGFYLFVDVFIFFSFAKTKMQGYILFTSPALFLMTSEFWFMLLDYKIKHKSKLI